MFDSLLNIPASTFGSSTLSGVGNFYRKTTVRLENGHSTFSVRSGCTVAWYEGSYQDVYLKH
jgi:hypothetical protein